MKGNLNNKDHAQGKHPEKAASNTQGQQDYLIREQAEYYR